MKRRPTQADVAKMAGVSTATVSYVINNQSGGKISISPMTRARVLDAIAELGYEPDSRARSLRSGGTDTIGLLIPDTRNPHYWEIAEGVEQETRAAGYEMLVASTAMDPQREINTLNALMRRRIDALILTLSYPKQTQDLLERLSTQRHAVVTLGSPILDLDWVETGYAKVTPQLLNHLHALGHRRIGFVHGVGSAEVATNRITIFQAWHDERGLNLDRALIIECGNSIDDGYQATCVLLAMTPRPTAIVTVNDLLAMGAMRAIYEAGLRVPADISVAGFDDIPMAAYLSPPLTTVNANARTIGRQAAAIALQRIRQPDLLVQNACVEAALVVRASTGSVPV